MKQAPAQSSPSILRKSSWPFAGPVDTRGLEGPGWLLLELVAAEKATFCAFLLPNPARGREAADRGINKPPVAGGAPAGRLELVASRLSPDSCSVWPSRTIGSGCNNSFPTS